MSLSGFAHVAGADAELRRVIVRLVTFGCPRGRRRGDEAKPDVDM